VNFLYRNWWTLRLIFRIHPTSELSRKHTKGGSSMPRS
jgi:hypothetical protein